MALFRVNWVLEGWQPLTGYAVGVGGGLEQGWGKKLGWELKMRVWGAGGGGVGAGGLGRGGFWGGGAWGGSELHLQAVPAHVPANPLACKNCKRGGSSSRYTCVYLVGGPKEGWNGPFELFKQRSRYYEQSPSCDLATVKES